MIKRGLIHVENTEGLLDFARFLTDFGWTILSANKTEEFLKKEGIPVVRENALVPVNVHLSDSSDVVRRILSAKNEDSSRYETENSGKKDDSISLVCININPYMKMEPKMQEMEDLMNPSNFQISTILRDSFVNYKNLLILTDPADYKEAMIQIRTDNVTDEFRMYLAAKALNLISAYDGGISSTVLMSKSLKQGNFMNYLMFPFIKQDSFKNGANPQQISCLYKYPSETGAVNGFNRYSGLQADYNIISDSACAWEIISSLYNNLRTQYTVDSTNCDGYKFTTQFTPLTGTVFTIAVKFKSVIGAALSTNVLESFRNTYGYDSENIKDVSFGSSAVIDEDAAKEMVKCNAAAIVAPGFTSEAKAIFSQNPSIRLIPIAKTAISPFDLQLVNGGLIFQTKDSCIFDKWQVKTRTRPSQYIIDEMAFGMVLAMGSRTHCAVLVKDNAVAGISQCCKSAAKALEHVIEEGREFQKRCGQGNNPDYKLADVIVFDTDVSLSDGLKQVINAGVCAIIQTGNNEPAEEFIKYCDEHGVSLIYTGITHISY